MSPDATVSIAVSRAFDAPAERVFDAWLDPTTAGQWLFATPGGQMQQVTIDPRVGSRFTVIERRDTMDAEHIGEYVELNRPHRLVFDFSVPQFSAESTRVVVEITPGERGCHLMLTHHGVLSDYAERTQAGWSGILDGLAKTLG